MTETGLPKPEVTTQEAWLAARKELLAEEKELTKQMDRVSARRRRLPMVKIEKDYTFDGPEGKVSLLDLFEGKHQLIVYHFMFDPRWEEGCEGCTGFVDALGDLSLLGKRDTAFVLISRAPLAKLEDYKAKRGWDEKWVSSFASDFNYDFQATNDKSKGLMEYNYKPTEHEGEGHGISVFFRDGDELYHTYSSYGRGCEGLVDTYRLLDVTPYGRQEDFEDSPAGWPQAPTYG
ncbi:DUF899 domain-containing protein [bacterium]|nr:MAG: DUF899 domain-containing protein [bacterium]